ncbi:hypothetical protein BAE44_0020947, partial [Dichanthelium oligosanthes]
LGDRPISYRRFVSFSSSIFRRYSSIPHLPRATDVAAAPHRAAATAQSAAGASPAPPHRLPVGCENFASDLDYLLSSRNSMHLIKRPSKGHALTGRRRPQGDLPVGLKDAIHAAPLEDAPSRSVTRYLAARSTRELREMAAALESDSPDTLRLLEEHVPGLAAVMEQVRHLLDIVAVDEAAALEAKSKKRPLQSSPTTTIAAPSSARWKTAASRARSWFLLR